MVLPGIPFLKGDKDKDREKEKDKEKERDKDRDEKKDRDGGKSQASGFSSPTPTSYHQSNSSISSSTVDSPTSKYHPSRLLRRKASVSAKAADASASLSDPEPPFTASSAGSVFEHQQFIPPTSPRGLFSELGGREDSERDRYRVYPRRGSENLGQRGAEFGPSSASKRAAWVYQKQGEDDDDGDGVVVIPEENGGAKGGDVFGSIGVGLGALGLGSGGERKNVIKDDINARIAYDQGSLIDTKVTHRRPLTPPDSSASSHVPVIYPTALSPPRRPMPKSPRAMQNMQRQQQRLQPPTTPPSISQTLANAREGSPEPVASPMTSLETPGVASSPSPSPAQSRSSPRPLSQPQIPRTPLVTAEWLKRKPSSGRLRHASSLSADQIPHPPPLPSGLISTPPLSTKSPRRTLDESPRIHTSLAAQRMRNTSISSTNSDTDALSSSDGEIGLRSPQRRSRLTATPSRPSSSARSSPAPPQGGYEVHVTCVDDREERDEMKWEVTIRRRSSRNMPQGPSSPLQLSTASSITSAPATASSINLSLALDQPTGKLVFISFPMDIHATPTRRRRPSQSQPPAGQSGTYTASPRKATFGPERPVTPPPTRKEGEPSGPGTPRPVTPGSSSRRKAPPPWPSPMARKDGDDSS
ncbi:hypothetical protein IAT38_005995 [Cryptococcus sp. DSM 104549]